jgi:hypothetical protein
MKKPIITFLLALTVFPLWSQVEQMIIPSDLRQETVITEPATLRKGYLRAGLFSTYSVIDKIFNDEGRRAYVLGSNGWATSWMYQASLMYGITDRLMVGADLPYMNDRYYISNESYLPGFDTTVIYTSKINARGLSDIDISIDYQLIYINAGKTSLKAQAYLSLPTGQKNPENVVSNNEFDKPTGRGHASLDARLIYRQIVYPYSFSGYLSYKYNFKGSKVHYPGEQEVSYQDGGLFYLGGSFNIHLNDWIALMNELSFTTWADDDYYGDTSADVELDGRYLINYQPALVFQVRRFRFFEVVHLPVKGKNTGADPGYVFGLQYTF